MREIIFDTETTGFDPQTGDRMVEIGCIEMIDRIETVLARPGALVKSNAFTGRDRRRRDGKAPVKRRGSDRRG